MMVIASRRVMLQDLFSSRVRVRLLQVFLLNPDMPFHARQLARQIPAQYNAVWKELNHLERAGILSSESRANIKEYRLNPSYPLIPELRSMVLKTVAFGDTVRQALAGLPKVQAAFIYGSAANGDFNYDSDVDLMVIGEVDLLKFAPRIANLEKDLGREINYIIYTPREWRAKQARRDPFIMNVLKAPKLMLIGSEDALRSTSPAKAHQPLSSLAARNQGAPQTRRPR